LANFKYVEIAREWPDAFRIVGSGTLEDVDDRFTTEHWKLRDAASGDNLEVHNDPELSREIDHTVHISLTVRKSCHSLPFLASFDSFPLRSRKSLASLVAICQSASARSPRNRFRMYFPEAFP
jgi:hypothetical protein